MEQKNLIENKIILQLLEKYKVVWALGHMSALAHWDLSTYMPKEGINARGEALGKIASLSQEIFLNKEFVELIKIAEKEELNDYEKAIIRTLNRYLKYYQKIPKEFIEKFEKLTTEAQSVWEIAREKNDFLLFQPYLERIVEMSRKKAEYLGYEKHPYDALLDEYEEGLTTEYVEKYFESIKEPLINLINKIKSSKKFRQEHDLEEESYETENMKDLNNKILEFLHYNMDHIRIDVSAHPFSTSLGKGDARITTRYEGKDFARSYSSTIHEYGHSLYEIQSHEELHYTPISGGNSLVIHESQSRFWENFIGKSKSFIELMYKDFLLISSNIKKYSIDEIYKYFNLVKPSLIRTEADEVTYHLHVLIRFEIEKDLIEGKIQVKDLPKIWNDKYKDYLGVIPKNDSEGVLQDIHWSHGSIGYFPTYSLGTALSTQWKYYLEKDIGKIDELVKNKEGIRKIQEWLSNKIHQYGSTYIFNDLTKKSTEENFNPKYLLEYLNGKYSSIYELL